MRSLWRWLGFQWLSSSRLPFCRTELPGLKAAVTSVAFSPDGKLIVAGGGGNAEEGKDYAVFVWDSASFKLRNKLRLSGPVTSVAFSQDGKRLAAGMHGRQTHEIARVWDIETMGELHAFRTEGLRGSCRISVAFATEPTTRTRRQRSPDPEGPHWIDSRYCLCTGWQATRERQQRRHDQDLVRRR